MPVIAWHVPSSESPTLEFRAMKAIFVPHTLCVFCYVNHCFSFGWSKGGGGVHNLLMLSANAKFDRQYFPL